jgi:4-hydroxy-tetrahydrodipicolinate synthase
MIKTDFISGIIPAMVTPMKADESIDEGGLEELIEYLVSAGVDGLFAVGTAGEFWALNPDEKERVFIRAVRSVAGRVPVYAGTTANTTAEAVDLACRAQGAGVDCLSVLTPSFIAPDDGQLYAYYRAIATAVEVPVLLYSNPDRTGNKLSVDLVVRLAEEVENIVGIKDSAGDMAQTAEYLRRTPDGFRVLMGRDTLIYAGLVHGAAGAIAASANIAPELSVGIFENFAWGDMEKALEYQNRLAPLRQAFGLGTFPAVLKAGVELLGLQAGPPRAPVGPLNAKQREALRRVLVQIGKLDAGGRHIELPESRAEDLESISMQPVSV